MRRIELRFYQKICIHGMSLDDIAKEIDGMDHKTIAAYQADSMMFQTPYKLAREIISNLARRNLIIEVNGRYKQNKNRDKTR